MGAVRDMWIAEHECIPERFANDELDLEGVKDALRRLGFDEHEIQDQIDALRDDHPDHPDFRDTLS